MNRKKTDTCWHIFALTVTIANGKTCIHDSLFKIEPLWQIPYHSRSNRRSEDKFKPQHINGVMSKVGQVWRTMHTWVKQWKRQIKEVELSSRMDDNHQQSSGTEDSVRYARQFKYQVFRRRMISTSLKINGGILKLFCDASPFTNVSFLEINEVLPKPLFSNCSMCLI